MTDIKQHRPAAKPIAEIADQRRENELHSGIGEEQPAAVNRRMPHIRTGQFLKIFGQNRNDDPDADNIQQQDHEDECQAAFGQDRVNHRKTRKWRLCPRLTRKIVVSLRIARNNT